MDFWQRYRAIDTRDSRFDGQFYTAVKSTGIYCRPSCPARTPKPENVEFFETSAAAHESGYRACKRCLPEAVPGTPAWNVRSDVAGRAMRLINDGVVDDGGVPALAARLGYSTRQLGRILTQELGAGPLALARAARAQTARQLLVSTRMGVADVAFASGFNSVRQFNETVLQVYDRTPGQLRATAPAAERVAQRRTVPETPGSLSLRLPYRGELEPGIFAFLAARAIPGVELAGPDFYERALALPHGVAHFRVSLTRGALELTIRSVALKDLHTLITRVRRLFDLDADPEAVDGVLEGDPRLAPQVRALPGMRLPGALDPQEMLVRAMVGQQITVAAARTALGGLSACGEPFSPTAQRSPEDPEQAITRLFPAPAALAEKLPELLRGPARRTGSLQKVTAAMASGELDFGFGDTPETLAAKLLPQPGVGPWTVGYLSMRVLGSPDVFLAGDAAIRNGIRSIGGDGDPAFAGVSPWRSYATLHLWRAALTAPRRSTTTPSNDSERTAHHG
ncbi:MULTISPECIES: AlkA N-terminal domain-containing protein [Arthrobacter]|uniref:DNA-3-methyladenine glycosylase II n=2 Tax=Arthrobacter TaxID=1663 RepID=A0ABU9KM45_9MICC|nr:AlkA N-terminal domain-containing protein [Arthrobacter sp. YJM1]MDP5227899.1 Ada metal-binding domain-containing protein [Arthrobacter sp. YJM1]